MFARVVYGRLRSVSTEERREADEEAMGTLKRQPGFVAAYYFSPEEDQEGLLSISLWESKGAALEAMAQGEVQAAHSGFSVLLAAPPRNRIVAVEVEASPDTGAKPGERERRE